MAGRGAAVLPACRPPCQAAVGGGYCGLRARLCCAALQPHLDRAPPWTCTASALELYCRYGFRGFYDRKAKPVVLTKQAVEGIHMEGGTMLGTSRGGADLRRAPLMPTAHTA